MYANLSNHVADEAGLIEINSKRFELCARKWRNVEPDKLGRTLSILLDFAGVHTSSRPPLPSGLA